MLSEISSSTQIQLNGIRIQSNHSNISKLVEFNQKSSKSDDFNQNDLKNHLFLLISTIFDLLINIYIQNWLKFIKFESKIEYLNRKLVKFNQKSLKIG